MPGKDRSTLKKMAGASITVLIWLQHAHSHPSNAVPKYKHLLTFFQRILRIFFLGLKFQLEHPEHLLPRREGAGGQLFTHTLETIPDFH